jgi:hypothetical protein
MFAPGSPFAGVANSAFRAQRFEAGDDVEQFFIDATLAQAMAGPVKIL